jgi:Cell shape-determining protein
VRVAVLGDSVQKSASSRYSSNRSSALRRRIVVGILVLLALVLITVSFRSSALDGVQSTGASILQPFEVAANRVAAPFRDAAGWAHGLVNAKNQNKKLRRENQQLQQKLIYDEQAVQENVQLRAQLDFKGVPGLDQFNRVNTEVQTNPQNAIDQSVTIAAGSSSGIAAGDVVVSPAGGLVGIVDKTFSGVSRVTLLTDEQSSVTVHRPDQPDGDRRGAPRRRRQHRAGARPRAEGEVRRRRRQGDHRRVAGQGRAAVDVPARHPRRHGDERERHRREPVQDDPGAAGRRLLVAALGDRAGPPRGKH